MASTAFRRFVVVGGIGFAIDAGVLSWLAWLGSNLYLARAVSFTLAVAATYFLNRRFSFQSARSSAAVEKTAAVGYGAIQLGGAMLNLGVFTLLIWLYQPLAQLPVVPLAVGAVAGLLFNYFFSAMLFRWKAQHDPH